MQAKTLSIIIYSGCCSDRSRARTTIEDFVLSYFPLHGLSSQQDFLKYWDILVFVEATIYEMDEENEALSQAGGTNPDHNFLGTQGAQNISLCANLSVSIWFELVCVQARRYSVKCCRRRTS